MSSSDPGISPGQREIWNRIYRDVPAGRSSGDEWLERWTEVLDANAGLPILELGCGSGQDTRYLVTRGLDVLATDFSEEALRLTRINAPGVETRQVDISEPLPFSDSCFGIVVASLSLHYFPWKRTEKIVSEISRVLLPGGWLLARFNSTNDRFHGASEKVEIEENFYEIRNLPRRLFDRESIERLFGSGWKIESADERTTGRYGREKTLWEVAVRRRVPPAR